MIIDQNLQYRKQKLASKRRFKVLPNNQRGDLRFYLTLVIILLPSQYMVTETSIIRVYNFNRPIKQCELVRNQRMDETIEKEK